MRLVKNRIYKKSYTIRYHLYGMYENDGTCVSKANLALSMLKRDSPFYLSSVSFV